MKKFALIIPLIFVIVTAASPLHAHGEGGWRTDSPENLTVVFGLAVSAASIGFVQIRNRFRIGKK